MSKDVYQVREINKSNDVVTVEYSRPKFWHRCMANFVDFFLFAILTFSLFLGTRGIVQSTPDYISVQRQIETIQLNSGLYKESPSAENSTKNVDLIYYLNTYKANTPAGKEFDTEITDEPQFLNGICIKAIKIFIKYCGENCSEARYNDLLTYYDQARLTPTLDGIHFFIEDDTGKIIPNETLVSDATKLKSFYAKVYTPFIEKKCIPFLTANVPGYRDLTRVDFNLLVFLELPVAYTLAAILVYFVPPLFFRRGRKTLGKALYHIGLIDTRLLSPTLPRYLARFGILFFGELLLSVFTFGIPYIISFSMMAFTEKKQGFPDYMLKLIEVDTSKANIYMDYVEAALKNELHGKAIDFNLEKPL